MHFASNVDAATATESALLLLDADVAEHTFLGRYALQRICLFLTPAVDWEPHLITSSIVLLAS